MNVDYLIVGTGLTGATIARTLADKGHSVHMVERRPHIAGNVFDCLHESGIRYHFYGPHYFRTNADRIWEFVNRFTTFEPFAATLMSMIDGKHEYWPIQEEYILRTVGAAWKPGFSGTPANFEEASLGLMPRPIYEKFVKGYTEKQWGKPCTALAAELAGRFDVRTDGETRLKRDKYQGIPTHGYTEFVRSMIAGIPVTLNFDYLQNRDEILPRCMTIFTGPIDEYFGFDFGRLLYRGQKRDHFYYEDKDSFQPACQVNYPSAQDGPKIRTLEWKKMLPERFVQKIKGTLVTSETPFTPEDPAGFEYPFPDAANAALYQRYAERARELKNVLICGRLGEYRYYDMDAAIARGLKLAEQMI